MYTYLWKSGISEAVEMAAVVDDVVVAVAGHDAVAGNLVRAYLHFVAAVAVAVGLTDQLVEVVPQRNP